VTESLLARLSDRAARTGAAAVRRALRDPERQAQLARAVGAVQRGQQGLTHAQQQLLHTLGFAHRGDYREIDRRLAALRRRAKAMLARLDRLSVERG
jgi:hypothetical protein